MTPHTPLHTLHLLHALCTASTASLYCMCCGHCRYAHVNPVKLCFHPGSSSAFCAAPTSTSPACATARGASGCCGTWGMRRSCRCSARSCRSSTNGWTWGCYARFYRRRPLPGPRPGVCEAEGHAVAVEPAGRHCRPPTGALDFLCFFCAFAKCAERSLREVLHLYRIVDTS